MHTHKEIYYAGKDGYAYVRIIFKYNNDDVVDLANVVFVPWSADIVTQTSAVARSDIV